MKTNFMYVLLVLLACTHVGAQDTLHFSRGPIRIKPSKLKLLDEAGKRDGVLYQLRDSSILVANKMDFGDSLYRVTEISELYIEDIGSIYSDKGQRTIVGALIGAAGGFVVGFITGYVDCQRRSDQSGWYSMSPEFSGISMGITFSLGGVLVGGIAGSRSSKVPINGSLHQYNSQRERLDKYTIKKD